MNAPLWKRMAAECVGTFVLVLVGCGAMAVAKTHGNPSHEGVGLCFGLVVMAMIYALGDVSGAHLNPAVSVGFWAAGRMKVRDVGAYAAAQCAGAVAAAWLLRVWLGPESGLGATMPAGDMGAVRITAWGAMGIEAVLTGVLMFVILSVATGAKEKGLMAGVAIGGTVAMRALWAGSLTNASMNPARSLGPALAGGGMWEDQWVYWVGPLVGALCAVAVCKLVHEKGGCCVQGE